MRQATAPNFKRELASLHERVRRLESGAALTRPHPKFLTAGGTPLFARFTMSNDAGGGGIDCRFGANRQTDWASLPFDTVAAGSDAGFCALLTAAESQSGRAGAVRINDAGLYLFTLKLSLWLRLTATGTKLDNTTVTPAYDGSVWGLACDGWYSSDVNATEHFDAWYDIDSQRGTIEQGQYGVMDRTLTALRRITIAGGDFEVDVRGAWVPDNIANSQAQFTSLLTINGEPSGQYATSLSVAKLG